MIKLTITEKGGEPRVLSFDQNEVSIGRVQGNDVVLAKGNISKRHSKLTLTDGRIMVSDIKSTNGTYVNGRKIAEPTTARPGDKIFVGDFLIVIDAGSASGETSSTGGRRAAPPPPPPPPPRPGGMARGMSVFEGNETNDTADGPGEVSDKPFYAGSGRPPAPPPPPPRRTIVMPHLEDDSVDIGTTDAPPSLADVGANAGRDPVTGLAGDVEEDGGATASDTGNDVFGSKPAADEDAALAADLALASGYSAGPAVSAPGKHTSELVTPAPANAFPSRVGPPELAQITPGSVAGASVVTLESLLADPAVTSILIGAGARAEVERNGKLDPPASIGDANVVAETVWQIANTAVPPPAADNPVVDVRLPDGTRVTALFPPITSAPVCAAIRKSTVSELTLADIAGSGDVEKILVAALASRRNLLLAGDGPALDALAGALAGAFPPDRRILSIGAGAKSRPGWIELAPGLDPAGLVRAAVAFRADHILVAEPGGTELPELLLAAARGQEGLIASIGARTATEALGRLRAFSVRILGTAGFASLVTNTIDLIVLAGAAAGDGGIRILEIAEPVIEGDTLVPAFVARRSQTDRTATTLEVAGVSTRLAGAIAAAGDSLAAHLVRR